MFVFYLLSVGIVCISLTYGSGPNGNHYGTKTAYRNRRIIPGDFKEDSDFLHNECTIAHVSQIFRHGTRYPSRKQIQKISKLHDRLVSSESGRNMLPSSIHGWKNPFGDRDLEEKPLSSVGEEEMMVIGRRFRKRYQNRMTVVGQNLHVISSNLTRAIHSSMSFLKGLEIHVSEVLFERKEKLIRFFAYCDRYKASVKKNKTALREYHRFKDGPEVLKIVNNVKKRFQLTDVEFSADDIELVYVMCGFEIANNVSSFDKSPWCHFFNPDESEVLEYLQDIRQYWRKSYPYEVNIMQGCQLAADIVHNLHESKSFLGRPANFMLYFGHAETVMPILGLLGLMREKQHLKADNFMDFVSNRTFRTAAIVPFSANLAIELYRCEGDKKAQYYVRPLLNEAPIMWNLCDRSFCPYGVVKKLLMKCVPGYYDHDDTCGLKRDNIEKQSETKKEKVKDEL